MPRTPKPRKDFYADATHLLRLGRAILNDATLPAPWRKDMDARLKDLASDLLQAPERYNVPVGVSIAKRSPTPPKGVSAELDEKMESLAAGPFGESGDPEDD